MSYLVFARKYRPQSFAEVSGQEAVVTTLRNAIASGRIAHAFLFAGPRGVGKTTTARLLAKALNCEQGPTAEPCGSCASCSETAEGHSIDVLEIDGASNRLVEHAEALRESIQYSPARDRYKVVILDEVHMLSGHAFNALLKTLEEPPPHVKFIFATTELRKVPATILSRCQVYEFRRIPFPMLLERLRQIVRREGIEASDEALAIIARQADGCLRDAQSALDQVVAFSGGAITEEGTRSVLGLVGTEVLFETVDAVLAEDGARLLALVDGLVDRGVDLRQFAAAMTEHLRNLVVARLTAEPGPLVALAESELPRLSAQAAALGEEDGLRLFNLLAQAEEELRRSTAPRFTLERSLLKLRHARGLVPIAELVAAVRSGQPVAAALPATPAPPRPPAARPAPPVESALAPAAPAATVAATAAAPPPAEPAAPAPAVVATAPPPAAALPTAPEPATISPAAVAAAPAPAASTPAAPAAPAAPAGRARAGVSRNLESRLKALKTSGPAAAGSGASEPVSASGSDPEPATERSPAAPAKAALKERARKDPSMGKLLDLFKAEIVDVDENH